MTEKEGFWARRLKAVQEEEEQEARAAALKAEQEAARKQEEEWEGKTEAEILAELDLPDPDTLEKGDDFSRFLSDQLPESIRRRALRRLWRLNPVLANVDGLVDYGEDFTDAATVIEGLQTTYQVGKGMLAHVQEIARQEEEKAAAEADELVAETEPSAPPEQETDDSAQTLQFPDENTPDTAVDTTRITTIVEFPETGAQSHTETTAEAEVPIPRRMRFEFEGPDT
ncbi:MAG: DUF3306 domain-containing protein [Rhodobacteraceae bacterium]|nr:DUF3306 domain-containing protein [Paracoccaceae bacterium]